MCKVEDDCCCGGEAHEGHHGGFDGHYGHYMGYGFPLMSIEEEVKVLEKMKTTLVERLEIVNKRLEILKR